MPVLNKFNTYKKYYSIFIFLLIFSIYLLSPLAITTDSRFAIATSYSLIKEGNTDLDEYYNINQNHYAIEKINGHIYTMYPIGTHLLATPFVFLFSKMFPNFKNNLSYNIPFATRMELLIASFITALTAIFIYKITYILSQSNKMSITSVFIFALATPAWSTASRVLWQHGPSMLMLAISLYLIILAKNNPKMIQFVSLPLFFSFFIRPTNFISVGLFSIYILIFYKKYFLKYIAWGMLIVIPITIWHLSLYHAILPNYFIRPCQTCKITPDSNLSLLSGLAGTLISPNRGLFIFSPVLLFSIYGAYLIIKKKLEPNRLPYFIVAIIILHWILISTFREWWGGFAFGPRYFTDVMPYFVYLLLPATKKINQLKNSRQMIYLASFCFTLLVSVAIHYNGSFNIETWQWNFYDASVFHQRVWNYSDLQFLR